MTLAAGPSSDARSRLLALLATGKCGSRAATPSDQITRQHADRAPASPTQQRFWFMEQVEPGNPAYHCPSALRLTGNVNLTALRAAVQLVVERHEILRTTYHVVNGELWQQVQSPTADPLTVHDLRGQLATAQLVEDAVAGRTELNLVAGPVFRAELFRTLDDEQVLVCTAHHIAFDGWSTTLLWREIGAAYAAFAAGLEPSLTEVELQYSDVARWECQQLSGPRLERGLAFWRERLAGASAPDLPRRRDRLEVASDIGAMVRIDLPTELMARLSILAGSQSTTLFATLVTGLALTVARWSGGDDIVLGTAVLGRDRPELAGVVGCLINTIVLRIRLRNDMDLRSLLSEVGADLRSSLGHAGVPFDRVIREVAPVRDGARVPLLDVHLTMEESDQEVPAFADLNVDPLMPELTAAKFDLGVNVRLQPAGDARLGLLFHTDRFNESVATRFLRQLRSCLESMVNDPDAPWHAVEVLDPAERTTVIETFNETALKLTGDVSLPELVRQQARRRPHAGAVVTAGGQTVGYRELVEAGDQLAISLRRYSVGPGDIVALASRRGVEFVIGLLGVMATGAAYLPIDPDYPAIRIEHLLTDSRASIVLLTDGVFAEPFAGHTVLRLRELLDSTLNLGLALDHVEALPNVDPDSPAYVMYTSGSTGAPKGAVLAHRGVVNSLLGINQRCGVDENDTVLALSSPSFDASVYDILATLVVGGTVVLVDPDDGRDPAQWLAAVQTERVTVWHSAPALGELFVAAAEAAGELLGLRRALVSGDWIPLTLPGRLRAVAPELKFYSLGGATEASVDSVAYEVGDVDPDWRSIPYGRPLPNQHAFVLDAHAQPVPIGVAGELYLGGAGVGVGYLHRGELTVERYPAVQWRTETGPRRLYRTGDRARFDADGTLELLGRIDRQLKVHGLRVEPGEIEAALRAHPAVDEVVVVVVGEGTARRLAAAWTLMAEVGGVAGGIPTGTDLRAFLAERLPAALVPAVIVALKRFPLTQHNKLDRLAITALAASSVGPDATALSAGPVGPDEALIAATWQLLLGVDGIGRDDDFFALGGDSYLAIKAVVQIDPRLRVMDLFAEPTVRGLATRLAGPRAERGFWQRFGDGADGNRPVFLGVPFGGGSALVYRELAHALPEYTVLALNAPGHDPAGPAEAMLDVPDLVRRSADEVAALGRPVVIYGHCSGVATAVELARELEARGVTVESTYLAAALPDLDPDASLQRSSGDDELRAALTALGAFDGPLDADRADRLLTIARHDLYEALFSFQRAAHQPAPALRSPLRCVLGDSDLATAGHEDQVRDWSTFGDVASVDVLPDAGHYFLTTAAGRLAALIRRHERLSISMTAEETA